VSRQLQLLESELGIEIFHRTRNRVVGLTEPGALVVERARRALSEVEALTSLREDLAASDRGPLTIATTHTHARYVLPDVIGSFVSDYPNVQISLKQGDPEGICRLVDDGEADLAIGTEVLTSYPRLVNLACFSLDRVVVAPDGHPILDEDELTLESIAILTSIAFGRRRDDGLSARAADHLFASSTTYVKLRSSLYLRPYMLDFLHRLAPRLTPAAVRQGMANAIRDG
jgi:LysR family cys regulon transcriptional activator